MEAKITPKIDFWSFFFDVFFGTLIFNSFFDIFFCFFEARNLENSDFTIGKCIFSRFAFLALAGQNCTKCVRKSMDFEVENREKSIKIGVEK